MGTYREYRTYSLGKLQNGGFDFQLIEFDEDTHSKLICYRKSEKSAGGISWMEIDYLDPVYDFSRTRAEVNRKKVRAMGMKLGEPLVVKESSVKLDHPLSKHSALLRRLVENGRLKTVLEIQRLDETAWRSEEPLESAALFAERYSLDLSE